MAYVNTGNGFNVTSASYVDERIILTKAQMLTAEDDYFLPDIYFAFCPDDNQWYCYNIDNEEDPETGKYRLMPTGLVNDVLVNGVSVVEDKIAKVDIIDDVKVDGQSVVEDGIANISLDEKQDKLTAGDKIKIENNVISVEGLKDYDAGYGLNLDDNGTFSVDTSRIATLDAIPNNVSQLANDIGFVTKAVANLENYYLKAETYTRDEVNNLISGIAGGVELEVVVALPLIGEASTIYLVRRSIDSNVYDQYIWFNNNWVQVGSTEVDLSQYYTKEEVDSKLSNDYQGKLTAGAGISLNNNFISVDTGNSIYTEGNKLEVKHASPGQKGIVAYDDNTIKMNANGQLYAVNAGGGGEYVAGPNIQISGNVISATDTTYRAGDAIQIDSNNNINVLYDDETIHQNRKGELYMDAVPIDAGEGIKIKDGTISIIPSEVADAINLDDYQAKLVAGNNIQINGNVISATGGGSGGGANWGQIGGTLSNQSDLNQALNGKQKQLVAGSNITLTDLGTQVQISAAGGSGGSTSFANVTGSPYDNVPLANALNSKRNASDPISVSDISGLQPVAKSGDYNDLSNKPTIGTGTVSIYQGTNLKGTFNLNSTDNKQIVLDVGGGGSTPNDGMLTIQRNGATIQTFTANQSNNTIADIRIPIFSYDSSTGVLTITDNN